MKVINAVRWYKVGHIKRLQFELEIPSKLSFLWN